MPIDDFEQLKKLLKDIKEFFYTFEDKEKELNLSLLNKELERDDLLHEIELSKLNAIERMSVYSKLEKVLQERRILKNKIKLIDTLKSYNKKFIEKGICAETENLINNIETLKKTQENRQYAPRILKDLKCAKRKEKKE